MENGKLKKVGHKISENIQILNYMDLFVNSKKYFTYIYIFIKIYHQLLKLKRNPEFLFSKCGNALDLGVFLLIIDFIYFGK